jgi:hypothetical protein
MTIDGLRGETGKICVRISPYSKLAARCGKVKVEVEGVLALRGL